jgi:dipeptidase D
MIINHLEPTGLWTNFEEICKIPRLSKNEEKIIKFLEDFATRNSLSYKRDKSGNILIKRDASPGYENRKSVVLQSHLDMVGEKDSETKHDWSKDPITPIIDDNWIRADKTTLGADDGIGIAAQMLILTDKTIETGALECLFTVDEETGMTGAKTLKSDFFKSKILINLDSEDEGQLFIGCAGGIDSIATFTYEPVKAPAGLHTVEISLTGLLGGHSGDEIHRGFGNSVKIMNRLLIELDSLFGIHINKFNGGNLRNAIPREAFATILIKEGTYDIIKNYIKEFELKTITELGKVDPGLKIEAQAEEKSRETALSRANQESLNMAIEKCPHGVIGWSKSIEGLVETSTNLASVKFNSNSIVIVTSQRSSNDIAKKEISTRVETIFTSAGAEVFHPDGYPGWEPNTNSEILRITRESYLKLFNEEPLVRAIHAGLECGIILETYPGLDMISFGPTIKGAHTPKERINIPSTVKFWDLLVEVLKNIPAES